MEFHSFTEYLKAKASPCIGVCQVERSREVPYCHGCQRTLEEIAKWPTLDNETYVMMWKEIGLRRQVFKGHLRCKDPLGREITLRYPLKRIVSLVPSITQTLYDLGVEDRVVGITGYCPKKVKDKRVVGGTKNTRLSAIEKLSPDIILANKEENTKEQIEALESYAPVWVCEPKTLEDSVDLIFELGSIFGAIEEAGQLIDEVFRRFKGFKNKLSMRCIYLIWQDPFMSVGGDTFIHSWLNWLGLQNLTADHARYPEISRGMLAELSPDLVILPDEPFQFNEQHQQDIQAFLPQSKVVLVEGKHFTWFGSQMKEALDYFAQLQNKELHRSFLVRTSRLL